VKFIEKELRAVSAKGFCDLESGGEKGSLDEISLQVDKGATSSENNQQSSYKNHWANRMEEGNEAVSADIRQTENQQINMR
jgi:hypothetical protein